MVPFLGLSSLGSPQNQRFSFGLGSQNRIDGIPRAVVGVRPQVRVGVQGLFGRLVIQPGPVPTSRSPVNERLAGTPAALRPEGSSSSA
jgi:hypothetical protein